ncbi:YdcF family protein [Erwinia sp. J316]|uniref:YdcF family protein n=2 Tax=Erwinia sorbitola TaxID=2681984 RepID=A0A6I6EZS4_9GAMM|nr:YdcF family protein [Erwinia sorbitola]QGU89693.1 YdcF family protein [Erwinia sorbitola]
MILNPQNLDYLNTISHWLAVNDISGEQDLHGDVAILAGHAVLPGILGAFSRLAATTIPVLLSGGVGHSTGLLKTALNEMQITSAASSEAQLLADVAVERFGIHPERLIVEDQSRNCGENAAFSRRILQAREIEARRIIIIQDPLMQRRTVETFEHEWQRQGRQADFISWPVFIPQLTLQDGQIVMSGAASQQGLWTLERYVSMALGEVRRLRDDHNGYGPLGLGFIGHVDVPHAVEQAWQRLMADPELAALVR